MEANGGEGNEPKVSVILGTMTFGTKTVDVDCAAQMVQAAGCHMVDTAFLYEKGVSETILGEVLKGLPPHQRKTVHIATKANPFPGSGKTLKPCSVLHQMETSLQHLQVGSVDLFYLHSPDYDTPIEDTLSAVSELHRAGKFTEFGLSNFSTQQVEDIYNLCTANGWVVPSVYQGMYNAITRDVEPELFPTLKRLKIKFYAYNPLAGGLLTGKYTSFDEKPTEGRFVWRSHYMDRFWKLGQFEAVECIQKACEKHGISLTQASFWWLMKHSHLEPGLDGIIVGASSLEQLEENLKICRDAKELPADVIQAIDEAWELARPGCPSYFKVEPKKRRN